MTELNLGLSAGPKNQIAEGERKSTPRWLRVSIASLLSPLFPGLGQLYNRQPRKGLWIAVTLFLLLLIEGIFRTFDTFRGLIVHLLIWNGGRLLVLADACYGAWTRERQEASFRFPRIMFSFLGGVILFLGILPNFDWYVDRFLYIKAFRIPTDSMCPTVCLNERLVASMSAYKRQAPQRGDIILIQHKSSAQLFTKRVIGIGGDFVESGPGGAVLVNGKALAAVKICGHPIPPTNSFEVPPTFRSVKVSEGSFFLVGDNLGNSFDSRLPEFGFATLDQVKGKPLYLYWSPGKSRIGCPMK